MVVVEDHPEDFHGLEVLRRADFKPRLQESFARDHAGPVDRVGIAIMLQKQRHHLWMVPSVGGQMKRSVSLGVLAIDVSIKF